MLKGLAYTAYDSFYRESRIFTVDVGVSPAVITDETVLQDTNGNTFDLDIGRDRNTARATLGKGLAVSAFPRYVPV